MALTVGLPSSHRERECDVFARTAILACLAVLALSGCDTASSHRSVPTATPTDVLHTVMLYFTGNGSDGGAEAAVNSSREGPSARMGGSCSARFSSNDP
jgi:hypothetical protein